MENITELIPEELWLRIALFITCPFDISNLSMTCCLFYRVCNDPCVINNIKPIQTEWYLEPTIKVCGKIYGNHNSKFRHGLFEYIQFMNFFATFTLKTEYYHRGKLNGPMITYHGPTQAIKEYKEYKEGKLHGPHYCHNDQGDKIYHQVWNNGIKTGNELLETQKLIVSRNWNKGLKNGPETIMIFNIDRSAFFPNETIITAMIPWVNGKIHGTMTIERNEITIYKQIWNNGERSDYEIIDDYSGNPRFIVSWGGDKPTSAKQYNPLGNWQDTDVNSIKRHMALDTIIKYFETSDLSTLI